MQRVPASVRPLCDKKFDVKRERERERATGMEKWVISCRKLDNIL